MHMRVPWWVALPALLLAAALVAPAYPESNEQLEAEVWARRTLVPPGESLVLEHALEVRPTAGRAKR